MNLSTTLTEVKAPDLGNISAAEVIEIAVKPGVKVALDQTILTLETDKASMDIPAPLAGIVHAMKIQVGDKLSTGDLILLLETEVIADQQVEQSAITEAESTPQQHYDHFPEAKSTAMPVSQLENGVENEDSYAGPAVRRMARELGIALNKIAPSGPKGRILKEDVQRFIKEQRADNFSMSSALPSAPIVDFSQFGEIETKPLSRIKKLTASHLHRNWLLVPHVTQFDEADITDMEAFRKSQQSTAEESGIKLTPLAFIIKAVVTTLKKFPQFNASLSPDGEVLVIKKYFHIGIAVDTAEGLVVPVIRDVDKKSLLALAEALAIVSAKARAKQLTAQEMQGSSFTLSSLGGIGGTHFTPIINLPDVAILGVSKASFKPVYRNGEFVPRLLLPLALSYDHRVIDGAEGARFMVHLTRCLSDIRYWLL